MKFLPDGTGLRYATYLGGFRLEIPYSLVADSVGNLVFLGVTPLSISQ